MKCLYCDNGQFDKKRIRFPVELKGETLEVLSEAFVCSKCGESQMDSEQMNQLRKISADEYRKKHGLLTSAEISQYRKRLGMSQIQFAEYLNIGEASIKRWETFFIQDKSQDDHIRLKCDESYAELNALEVYRKSNPPDIYSGYRPFNLEIIKNVVSYFVKHGKAKSKLYLNKTIFYLDFLHYKKHNKSITGLRFLPIDFGPCPDGFQVLFSYLEKNGILTKKGKHNFVSNIEPNLSLFDDQEKETLARIVQILDKEGEQYLFNLSHEEKAFKDTEFAKPISYEFAKYLLIN
jgi:putative zinc finger/helix-turn-helix YgiT family protein